MRGVRSAGDAVVPVHLGTLRALEQGASLPLDRLDRLALGAPAHSTRRSACSTRFLRFHLGVELRSAAVSRRRAFATPRPA